jgi:hypothetical protein
MEKGQELWLVQFQPVLEMVQRQLVLVLVPDQPLGPGAASQKRCRKMQFHNPFGKSDGAA